MVLNRRELFLFKNSIMEVCKVLNKSLFDNYFFSQSAGNVQRTATSNK